MSTSTKKRLAIFASGRGSNARKLIEYFAGHEQIEVAMVVSSRVDAGVLDIAVEYSILPLVLHRGDFYDTTDFLTILERHQIDGIILAGFLWLVPPYLIQAFPDAIINIHPALLPKYGGKGMYGMHVHRAVHAAQEPMSGITIHYVNEQYDEGQTIAQYTVALVPTDAPEDIARKVLELEHRYFAPVVEQAFLSV